MIAVKDRHQCGPVEETLHSPWKRLPRTERPAHRAQGDWIIGAFHFERISGFQT
ncbi:MAG: hypothetical protein SGI92_01455 [Bryobacteraceae bacterium]|nr:hypothetical protein [Bryobacteraceae bacterium]